jgi:hypothetical protein
MKKPIQLDKWNINDTITVPCGYDMTSEPDLTRDNFNQLLEHYNNLVEVVNYLCEKRGLVFDDDMK